jgi:glycosyltransferase involved in cell wall biosynthesis
MLTTNTSPQIVAIIPAFNEEAYIGSVVLKTLEYVDRVIVVDDGSTDATATIAERAGANVVRHVQNRGKGAAMNTGFQVAKTLSPEVVVAMDGDWQHLPEEMVRVAEPVLRGEADMVVGSRYLESTSHVPPQRVLGHWWFTTMTNVCSGVALTDSQSGYRAFSNKAINSLSFSSTSFSVESEMQFLARDLHLKVAEVPITIRYHTKPKRSVLSHGLIVLNGLLRLVAQHRPLLFFGVPGIISAVTGLMLALHVINLYEMTAQLEVGSSFIVLAMLIIGAFLFFTSIVLHSIRSVLDDILTNTGKPLNTVMVSSFTES